MDEIRSLTKDEALDFVAKAIKNYARNYIEKGEEISKHSTIVFRVSNNDDDMYIDYGSYKNGYKNEQTKASLELFKVMSNNIIALLDSWNEIHTDDKFEHIIGKTVLSGARIGKSLFINKVPKDFMKHFIDFGIGEGNYYETKHQ